MKRTRPPQRIDRLLGDSAAARLLARARALGELDARVRQLIPAPLNAHCQVLSVRDTTLVLAADSPVWAARLRFQSTQLIKQLSGPGTVNLCTVQVRIRPPGERRPAHRTRRLQPLTQQTGRILGQAARDVSDPALKTALLRLAGRRNPIGRN